MEEWRRKRIEEVYAKWESRGRLSASSRAYQPPHKAQSAGHRPRHSNGTVGGGRNGRHGRQRIESAFVPLPTFVPSLGIDANALHMATVNKYTSLSRCCQTCFPSSRTKFYPDDSPGSGLQNILLVDRNHGILSRWFPYLTQSVCTKLDYTMSDLRPDTLNSSRVRDAIEACAKAKAENGTILYEEALAEQQKRARSIVYSMSSGVSSTVLRLVVWIVFRVFSRLFNQICVQKKHVHMLKLAQKCGVPIVFLPSHKSHLDYIIMTFVLFNLGIHIPRIAAGNNLNLPIISWMVRHLGGFFIKRKLDSSAGKDVLYRKCLHEYMEQCLLASENMEFFLEGSRSRSGKLTSPKAGLLSVLMDTVREGIVEDILVVPVNISYDKLLEKSFVPHELMGGSKKPETFLDPIRGAWTMLSANIGSVRIDFAQPFSLQEYILSAHISSLSLLELSNLSYSSSGVNLVKHTQRRLVTAASHHIVYDITQCTSLMPTWMVAFLLLFKHREGVSIINLTESYKWLESKTTSYGRAVSFTREATEAVYYALHYLGSLVLVSHPDSCQKNSLITFDTASRSNGLVSPHTVVRPQLECPDVFTLLHLANQVSSLLVLEGIVAASVLSAVSDKLHSPSRGSNSQLDVDKEEVLENAQILCKLFAREFIFAPPCVDLWNVLNDALESFIASALLSVPLDRMGGGRVSRPPQELDDDAVENKVRFTLKVNNNPESIDHLTFLSRIVGPLTEGYWITCIALAQVTEEDEMQEQEFLKQLREKIVEKTERGVLNYVESSSMDTLRNCLKSLADMNLVAYSNSTHFKVTNSDKLIDLAEFLVTFNC